MMTTIRTGNRSHSRAQIRDLEARLSYTIVDCRPIAAANRHSFFIPCQARLDAITTGDRVKLIFEPADPDDRAERMWVLVTGCSGEDLLGELANQPFGRVGVRFGSRVSFKRYHVIDIATDRSDDPAEINVQDPVVFHRCLMDARVYRGDIPLARIVRDTPPPEGYGPAAGDIFPWSGWRLEGEDFEAGMATEIGTPVIALRQRDDFAHLLQAPANSAFERIDGEWRVVA